MLRQKPGAFARQTPKAHSVEHSIYLQMSLGHVLPVVLHDVATVRPHDPIEHIAKFLYKSEDCELYFYEKATFAKESQILALELEKHREKRQWKIKYLRAQIQAIKALLLQERKMAMAQWTKLAKTVMNKPMARKESKDKTMERIEEAEEEVAETVVASVVRSSRGNSLSDSRSMSYSGSDKRPPSRLSRRATSSSIESSRLLSPSPSKPVYPPPTPTKIIPSPADRRAMKSKVRKQSKAGRKSSKAVRDDASSSTSSASEAYVPVRRKTQVMKKKALPKVKKEKTARRKIVKDDGSSSTSNSEESLPRGLATAQAMKRKAPPRKMSRRMSRSIVKEKPVARDLSTGSSTSSTSSSEETRAKPRMTAQKKLQSLARRRAQEITDATGEQKGLSELEHKTEARRVQKKGDKRLSTRSPKLSSLALSSHDLEEDMAVTEHPKPTRRVKKLGKSQRTGVEEEELLPADQRADSERSKDIEQPVIDTEEMDEAALERKLKLLEQSQKRGSPPDRDTYEEESIDDDGSWLREPEKRGETDSKRLRKAQRKQFQTRDVEEIQPESRSKRRKKKGEAVDADVEDRRYDVAAADEGEDEEYILSASHKKESKSHEQRSPSIEDEELPDHESSMVKGEMEIAETRVAAEAERKRKKKGQKGVELDLSEEYLPSERVRGGPIEEVRVQKVEKGRRKRKVKPQDDMSGEERTGSQYEITSRESESGLADEDCEREETLKEHRTARARRKKKEETYDEEGPGDRQGTPPEITSQEPEPGHTEEDSERVERRRERKAARARRKKKEEIYDEEGPGDREGTAPEITSQEPESGHTDEDYEREQRRKERKAARARRKKREEIYDDEGPDDRQGTETEIVRQEPESGHTDEDYEREQRRKERKAARERRKKREEIYDEEGPDDRQGTAPEITSQEPEPGPTDEVSEREERRKERKAARAKRKKREKIYDEEGPDDRQGTPTEMTSQEPESGHTDEDYEREQRRKERKAARARRKKREDTYDEEGPVDREGISTDMTSQEPESGPSEEIEREQRHKERRAARARRKKREETYDEEGPDDRQGTPPEITSQEPEHGLTDEVSGGEERHMERKSARARKKRRDERFDEEGPDDREGIATEITSQELESGLTEEISEREERPKERRAARVRRKKREETYDEEGPGEIESGITSRVSIIVDEDFDDKDQLAEREIARKDVSRGKPRSRLKQTGDVESKKRKSLATRTTGKADALGADEDGARSDVRSPASVRSAASISSSRGSSYSSSISSRRSSKRLSQLPSRDLSDTLQSSRRSSRVSTTYIQPQLCTWTLAGPFVLICQHPVLGEIRPQRSDITAFRRFPEHWVGLARWRQCLHTGHTFMYCPLVTCYNMFGRTRETGMFIWPDSLEFLAPEGYRCEVLYDHEIYTMCNPDFDDEEYENRMNAWTTEDWELTGVPEMDH